MRWTRLPSIIAVGGLGALGGNGSVTGCGGGGGVLDLVYDFLAAGTLSALGGVGGVGGAGNGSGSSGSSGPSGIPGVLMKYNGTVKTFLRADPSALQCLIHGKSDKTGSSPAEEPVHPMELLATIYHAFGIDPETIVVNHLKQPRELVKAKAVTK